MLLYRTILVAVVLLFMAACGDDVEQESATQKAVPQQQAAAGSSGTQISVGTGGVSVQIVPENPTSEGCLRALIKGNLGRSGIVWEVNGAIVKQGTEPGLCSQDYARDDLVTVKVGTDDQGAQASVKILNSPPRVVDISSSPDAIYAGVDVSVIPVAEDPDGDDVDFNYQWLINGVVNTDLDESTLPGNMFTKGDTIQVQVVPNDFFVDGPVYTSYEMAVPNAGPRITSQPPQAITSLDYNYQVVVTDPDDETFTFRLDEAPDGMAIDETSGLIHWSLVEATPGDHTIAIIASDPDGAEAAQEYTLTLSPAEQQVQ